MSIIIIVVTSVISIFSFSNKNLFNRLLFNPYQTRYKREWYRIVTHGFLHANWVHLIVNMMVLFSFSGIIESSFRLMAYRTWLKLPMLCYLVFYMMSIIVSSLITLRKHRDDFWYNSVGASGAVSAVLFCSIFFEPNMTLLFMGVVPLKAFIFGPLYLLYSWYSARKENDNINHDAHLWGAVFGFCFPLIVDPRMIQWFIGKLL